MIPSLTQCEAPTLIFYNFSLTPFLSNSQEAELNDHAATVLRHMKATRDIHLNNPPDAHKQKGELFFNFTWYLVMACWLKMYQQITHWSSQSFLYILSALKQEALQNTFKHVTSLKPSTCHDHALADALIVTLMDIYDMFLGLVMGILRVGFSDTQTCEHHTCTATGTVCAGSRYGFL